MPLDHQVIDKALQYRNANNLKEINQQTVIHLIEHHRPNKFKRYWAANKKYKLLYSKLTSNIPSLKNDIPK